MAMSDYSLSDIAAASDGNNGGFGGNGDGWWIILLFILLGGWGNRGWGGNSGGAGSVGGNELYPWMELQQTLCNGFANAETAATARQMATQQQMFGISQQFADCCCENRLGLANLSADIAREACADRQAVADGVQRIIDQMCADKIDQKNDEIAQLRTQINILNLAASQNAQTAAIIANNEAQTVALERYLAPTPIPAYTVQNPNCCQQNTCGCGSF